MTPCRLCGRPIEPIAGSSSWRHTESQLGSCRATSYDPTLPADLQWDMYLSRTARAAPMYPSEHYPTRDTTARGYRRQGAAAREQLKEWVRAEFERNPPPPMSAETVRVIRSILVPPAIRAVEQRAERERLGIPEAEQELGEQQQ